MIQIIYGPKGSGKTKRIINMANETVVKDHLGDMVYITDSSRYMHEIKYQMRFVNSNDINIKSEDAFIGFVQGMQEANYDMRIFFIDGVARIIGKHVDELKSFFERLETISLRTEATFILTVSAGYDELPEYIKQYATTDGAITCIT